MAMDPLYVSERASRERLWDNLWENYGPNSHRPLQESNVEEIRRPLSIIQIERDSESNYSQLFELRYRPDENYHKGPCLFCGNDLENHSWFSFEKKENDVVVPRWQPVHCTLHKLLDHMAQDFFPGRKVSLDTEKSRLISTFIFHEVDDLSTVMSTTEIHLQKQDPKMESFQAMNINQQLDALKDWLEICGKRSVEAGEHSDNDSENSDDDSENSDDDSENSIRASGDPHDSCPKVNSLAIPAKRILDLADAATGIVRIVEAAGRTGRYVALSHCWGDPTRHPIKSTQATMNDHMSGIAMSSLPRSFTDAIRVCLHLDIEYLWIDCLCIVQDDRDEWFTEAEKMSKIYQESYLTVAATRAQNSEHGFLFDFTEDTVQYRIVAEAPLDEEMSEYRPFHATYKINHESSKSHSAPLDKRVWCLQEWYLPLRVVEFCLNDIRFLCLGGVDTRFGRERDQRAHTRAILRGFAFKEEHGFRTFWETVRKDLFERALTYPSDKLPAIAGLAQMLEEKHLHIPNHKYLVGLWSTRISEDLSWTVLQFDAATQSIENIPSWSWASTTASYDCIYGRPSKTFVDLVEANCTGYSHSHKAQASLTVKGFVAPLSLRVDHKHKGDYDRPSLSFWVNSNFALASVTDEIKVPSTLYFVLDMPISPAAHIHQITGSTNNLALCRVPSIVRASKGEEKCKSCMERGYVSPVLLLLLTQTDVSLTALVLAPALSQLPKQKECQASMDSNVYHRLGLIEMDGIRKQPFMETSDNLKLPARAFWELDDPSARRTITIV